MEQLNEYSKKRKQAAEDITAFEYFTTTLPSVHYSVKLSSAPSGRFDKVPIQSI